MCLCCSVHSVLYLLLHQRLPPLIGVKTVKNTSGREWVCMPGTIIMWKWLRLTSHWPYSSARELLEATLALSWRGVVLCPGLVSRRNSSVRSVGVSELLNMWGCGTGGGVYALYVLSHLQSFSRRDEIRCQLVMFRLKGLTTGFRLNGDKRMRPGRPHRAPQQLQKMMFRRKSHQNFRVISRKFNTRRSPAAYVVLWVGTAA